MVFKRIAPLIAVLMLAVLLPAAAYAADDGALTSGVVDMDSLQQADDMQLNPQESVKELDMYRLYNPNSGEHFYTASAYERDSVIRAGWRYEGIGWRAPSVSNTPVYRLYNPNAGDHHYTMSAYERDDLKKKGWRDEGTGWYSDDNKTVALLRQYNPNAKAGAHNFTTSKFENDSLVKAGWRGEGTAWYALRDGATGTPIMGPCDISYKTMANWYRSMGATYPSGDLSKGGAPTIEDFAKIVCEEAAAEGVRADVVFCQSMLETGWLRFGGQVKINQFNFAGLGALDNGAAGASFKTVREGIRAQVQHLKLYACKDSLNNACVDPRWNAAVSTYGRGTAPTVELLATRWASSSSYAVNIVNLLNKLNAYA